MYWPALAVDCYSTVWCFLVCARILIQVRHKVQQMLLIPSTVPLESVAIDGLEKFIKTTPGNQYFLIITDRLTELTESVLLRNASACKAATTFVHESFLNYRPSGILLADNGKAFTEKVIQNVCRILNVQNLFTTTDHSHTNGRVKLFNPTLKADILNYFDDHPTEWNLYTPSLTYSYNFIRQTSTA